MCVVLVVGVVAAVAGCLGNNDDAAIRVNMAGFVNIMQNFSLTNDTEAKCIYGDLPGVEANDIVEIADVIDQVIDLPEDNVTQFRFASMQNAALYVEGNQTGVYTAGDHVMITFHIIKDVFQHPDQANMTEYLISTEAVQEIYNQTAHQYSMTMPPEAMAKEESTSNKQ